MRENNAPRIGLDVRLLSKRRGIGNYVKNLLEEFAGSAEHLEFVLYAASSDVAISVPKDQRFRLRIVKPAIYPLWEQWSLPRCAVQDKLDILHCPANAGPLWMPKRTKLILTIHDIMYMMPASEMPKSPSMYQRAGRAYLRHVVPRAARSAAAVITVSRHSLSDITKHIRLTGKLQAVIHEAPGRAFGKVTQEISAKVIAKHRIAGEYIIAFGAGDPRKNTIRIMEAFSRFVQQVGRCYSLVIVGLSNAEKEIFTKEAEKIGVRANVVFLGFISEDDLVALYSGAAMLVYPSLYEGFGFPVIEAMACGTPVVASASTSIPEIAGGAAILVDPRSTDAIAGAMTELVLNKDLRSEVIRRGLIRCGDFSWQRVAKETLAIYRRVIGS